MKIIKFILAILVVSGSPVHAMSASETAIDYFNILKGKDYSSAAAFFDPAGLDNFRSAMSFINDIPAESQGQFFQTFFGSRATKDSVSRMSNSEFFASFLRSVMVQAEAAGGVNFEGIKVLGEVMEGTDIAHVVTRNKVSVGTIELESMEVISFKKNGKVWNVLMSGKMKGMARQLRAAFSRPQ